jgi:HEAT repeat protein
MKDKEYLIRFLLDKTVDLGARDDCAMDLADFDDEEVLQALYKCASDPNEDNLIQSSCGESLAEIMVRKSLLDGKYIKGLSAYAFSELKNYFANNKPEWLTEV